MKNKTEEENNHYEIAVKELHESTTAEEQSYLAMVHSYQDQQQQLMNLCHCIHTIGKPHLMLY